MGLIELQGKVNASPFEDTYAAVSAESVKNFDEIAQHPDKYDLKNATGE